MVGMTKEQVLRCMGPPGNRMAEGSTEVWSYASGHGYVETFAAGSATTNAQTNRVGNFAFGNANTFSSTVSTQRFCQINIVINADTVSAVNYQGPTGGLLTAGEQCAYAVDACVVRK